MAFLMHHADRNGAAPFEYLPASGMTPVKGLALVLTGGNLTIASGTKKPEYICAATLDAVTEGTKIPVIHVTDDMTFATTASAALSGITLGERLQISADGLEVTVDRGGCCQLVAMGDDTDAEGGHVLVRITDPGTTAGA